MAHGSSKGLCAALILVLYGSIARGDDPWAPGSKLPEWRVINELQNYPISRDQPQPDFAVFCRDERTLVRLAACMAIGREADPKWVTALTPLLWDESELVRHQALQALVRLKSPEIKQPLLKVLGTWEELKPPFSFTQDRVTGLNRFGLPTGLLDLSLKERQRWLTEFPADEWNITFKEPTHELFSDPTGLKIWASIAAAEFDSTEEISVRLRIAGHAGKHPITIRLSDSSVLREVQFKDFVELQLTQPIARREQPLELKVPPGAVVEHELRFKVSRGTMFPGVYLLEVAEADWPLLVRVRRNVRTEQELPGLLSRFREQGVIEKLGTERFQDAVPAIVAECVANANKNNFATSQALARIGDPRAIPLLLQYPRLQHEDRVGSTFEALQVYGESADFEYSRYILAWRDNLEGPGAGALGMSLKLLGSRGSAEVDAARLELVDALTKSIPNDRRHPDFGQISTLRTALSGLADDHPDEELGVLLAMLDRPQALEYLVDEFRLGKRTDRGARLIGRLYKEAESTSNEAALKVLLRPAMHQVPEVILASKEPLKTAAEAEQIASYSLQVRSTIDHTVSRIDAYLQRDPQPSLKLALGMLLFEKRDFERSEVVLRDALANQSLKEGELVAVHCMLAEIDAVYGRWAKAKAHFEAASALMKPGVGYYRGPRDIEYRISELPRTADVPNLGLSRQRMKSTVEPNGYIEIAGQCAFYLDPYRTLRRWDLETKAEMSLGVMPNPVRQIVPIDHQRALALFKDGTSRLYRAGQAKPEWIGPKAIPHVAYISTGDNVITVADEKGALRALSADTGKTLWTTEVYVKNESEIEKRPEQVDDDPFLGGMHLEPVAGFEHPTWQGLAIRSNGLVIFPTHPNRGRLFRCLQAVDGKEVARFDVNFDVSEYVAAGDLMLAAGLGGQLSAFDLRDGSTLWNVQIKDAAAMYGEMAVACSGSNAPAYLSLKRELWAIDPKNGKTMWRWTWKPAYGQSTLESPFGPRGQLFVLDGGVIWVVEWNDDSRRDYVDVVSLSSTGKVLRHATSPLSEARSGPVQSFLIGDALFLNFDEDWERWPMNVND